MQPHILTLTVETGKFKQIKDSTYVSEGKNNSFTLSLRIKDSKKLEELESKVMDKIKEVVKSFQNEY